MLKLFRYLKKSIPSVILVILLLVVQAVSDLSLPSYTSDIVNIGIQQGGIDTTAPEVIRQSEMEKLLLFLNPEDQQTVMDSYRPDEELSDKEIKRLRKQYPAAADMPVYVRRELKEDALAELETIMSGPLLVVGGFQSDNEEMQAVKEQMLAGMPGGGADDLFTVLAQMPEEQKAQMVSAVQEQLAAMPESILEQSAIPFVKAEYVALGADANSLQTQYILKTGGIMLLIALLSAVAAITTGFLASRLAASLGRELRGRVFRKVVSFSNTEFDRYSTASLITRSTNDIQQIQMLLVMLLRVVFYAPIMGVGGVLKVLNTNTSMAWIIALAVGLLMILVLVLFATVMPRFKLMQKLVDRLNLVTREILTGLPVIRAFSTQKYEEERFDKANRDLTRTNLFVNRVMTCMMPAMMLIMNGIAVLIVWTGAHGVENGAMQVGDMMAFIQYTMQIIMAFLMISMVSVMLPRASVSAQRIEEVLQTKSVIEDPKESKPFDETKKGVVEYRHVSFRYPGAEENVLEDIDFTALPGQTTAFIGSTGSGKSTLINLLPRFYDVTEGEILVDGVDVREVTQHDLRARLGYVPQKGVLFSGTIASNLKYGHDEIGDEAMVEAAQIAQATEFINAKPDGYKAEIAQGGTNVSGGQKQRLSIARAIAARPEILIFDDSFSALDYKTDSALRKALHEEVGGSTVLIVAQRISTILHADQIIVLDEGRIVGKGTHEELLKTCEVYQQIAMSQLSKEELEK
ncbi:MAG: ABC transporter ATP-binding protein [Acutalibacteraceae bacterium]